MPRQANANARPAQAAQAPVCPPASKALPHAVAVACRRRLRGSGMPPQWPWLAPLTLRKRRSAAGRSLITAPRRTAGRSGRTSARTAGGRGRGGRTKRRAAQTAARGTRAHTPLWCLPCPCCPPVQCSQRCCSCKVLTVQAKQGPGRRQQPHQGHCPHLLPPFTFVRPPSHSLCTLPRAALLPSNFPPLPCLCPHCSGSLAQQDRKSVV